MPGAGLQIHKFSNTVSDAEDPGPDSWGHSLETESFRSLWHTLQQAMSRHWVGPDTNHLTHLRGEALDKTKSELVLFFIFFS